jgi:hypothetical protein
VVPTSTFNPQDLFCPLFSDFIGEKRKKIHFCLFEINVATQGVSLCYFHVNMYYNPSWFIFCEIDLLWGGVVK